MKSVIATDSGLTVSSHLTRGAWIEIDSTAGKVKNCNRRTSHEVRGLKLKVITRIKCYNLSHLTRGAWIEIHIRETTSVPLKSHLTRGAWIEIDIL